MRNTRSVEDLLPSRILEATNPGRERCYRQPREKSESTKGYCPEDHPCVWPKKRCKDLTARWNTFSSYFGEEGLSTQLASRWP